MALWEEAPWDCSSGCGTPPRRGSRTHDVRGAPGVPHLCTLEHSQHHLPHLSRRRLGDCCAAAGVRLDGAHAALADATATAGLLAWYLRAPTADASATVGMLRAAALLPWPQRSVRAVLSDARTERASALMASTTPLLGGWTGGQPLRVGDAVVFTGGDAERRAALERRSGDAGLRVVIAVSKRTAALVTDDVTSGTGKARTARELGTRIVDLRTFEVLVGHVQAAGVHT